MNGTAHMTIGAASGFLVANMIQVEPSSMMLLTGLGGIAGLAPDLDINGKLSNKITLSKNLFKMIARLIGVLVILYSMSEGISVSNVIGIGIGIGMIIAAQIVTQRRMLTITGIGVGITGVTLMQSWLILLGIFIIVSSFLPHRGYTHSILGLLFFALISFQFQVATGYEGAFITLFVGYASHLVADMKFLPFNRKGVKLFQPFIKKEF
ncbi:metal-dependent hydrolase [Bacillus badius]|uniref:metal-dependent hydrolase n=1 Tax=Bacillus badius TaxID=1455 RepID=UPI0007B3B167|nr:metal-dependent hydrolase [Bacillus badius]KZR59337.1 hydrolase [Bacillus badius]